MNKYIKYLISENTTVIIPKFGALLVTVSGKGIIMFNEHLKFNDGLLVNYVMSSEGIDKADAEKKVEAYALEILSCLDRGETYNIEGLGAFVKGNSGNIKFNQFKAEGVRSDAQKSSASHKDSIKNNEKKDKPSTNPDVKKTSDDLKEGKKSKSEKKKTEKSKSEKLEETLKNSNDKKETSNKSDLKSILEGKSKESLEQTKTSIDPLKSEKNVKSELDSVKKELTTDIDKNESKVDASKPVEKNDKISSTIEPLTTVTDKAPIDKLVNTLKPSDKEESSTKVSPLKNKDGEIKTDAPIEKVTDDKVKKPAKDLSKADFTKPTDHVAPLKESVNLPPVEQAKKPKRKRRLGLLILLLLLIGAGTFVALKYDMVKSWFDTETTAKGEDHNDSDHDAEGDHKDVNDDHDHDQKGDNGQEIESSNQEDDSLKEDNISENSEVTSEDQITNENDTTSTETDNSETEDSNGNQEEALTTVAQSTNTGNVKGNYHIIVSAFNSESNADNYVSSLKDMGFSNAVKVGRFDGFYQVASGSYSSKQDALSALTEARNKTGKAAWIFKY